MVYLNAVLLGIVEGLTEFLPISSTGHLILVERYLRLCDDPASHFPFSFMVIIQLPAVLAVVLYFWSTLWPFRGDSSHRDRTVLLWIKIAFSVLPAVVLGVLFNDIIEKYLSWEVPVALALVAGGVALLVIEGKSLSVRIPDIEAISFRSGFLVGCFQCLAMFPGVSRSAATIIGAMLLGASRPVAAEFSFFLAIPTMMGATTLTVLKRGLSFTPQEWVLLGIGCVASFITAYGAVAFLMNYIRRHDFRVFGYYRIVLGGIVLAAYFLRSLA
ncbi:MAG: undecaprenyl-diphosphate phosphatase [Candidatus Hydrogenedentes bacterium]|nr:undecaprenyl-diphosphate phosphatase [Candidatus Hydrogenedentota bacterium]